MRIGKRYTLTATMTVAVAGLLFCPALSRAQYDLSPVPPDESPLWAPLADGTSRISEGGVFFAGEFVFFQQNRTLGVQPVAFRGIIDATGASGNRPGTILGSGAEALSTGDLGLNSYQPGFRVTAGYRADDFTFYASYMNLASVKYSAGATVIPPFFQNDVNLTDSFLSSQVYNFAPQYNGPVANDTVLDLVIPGTTVGVWNAADVMDIAYTQRFSNVELVGRKGMFQSEHGRTYFTAGFRHSWFWESFWWRTTDYDFTNFAIPEFAAEYSNVLSQRMYGPSLGCGHDVDLGNGFAVSLDLSVAGLVSIAKQRAKYARADRATQAKRSQEQYTFVPNVNAEFNLAWRPVAGVEMKLGYSLLNYFNTIHMEQPIGFNMGAIDPVYEEGYYRYLQGFNIGLGLVF